MAHWFLMLVQLNRVLTFAFVAPADAAADALVAPTDADAFAAPAFALTWCFSSNAAALAPA